MIDLPEEFVLIGLYEKQVKLKRLYEKIVRMPLEESEFLLISKLITPSYKWRLEYRNATLGIVFGLLSACIIACLLSKLLWDNDAAVNVAGIFVIVLFIVLVQEVLFPGSSLSSTINTPRRSLITANNRIRALKIMVRSENPVNIPQIADILEISETPVWNSVCRWLDEFGELDDENNISVGSERTEEFIARLLSELALEKPSLFQ